jgi:hypothetical protein
MASHHDGTTLPRMVELPVAPSHPNLTPSVGFEQANQIPDSHALIPLHDPSGERNHRND